LREWFFGADVCIPVPVIAEISRGIAADASAARRMRMDAKLTDALDIFPVLSWDAETARIWAGLQFTRETRRNPQALWDSLIDAMGVRYDMPVATRNVSDFRHSTVFDPWTGSEHAPGKASA
jgi:predicted nucleic acid-binding protein